MTTVGTGQSEPVTRAARRFFAAIKRRLTGMLSARPPVPVFVLLVVTWAATAALIVLLVIPGGPEAMSSFDPLWLWAIPVVAAATAAAAWAAAHSLRLVGAAPAGAWQWLRRVGATTLPALVPIAVLWAQRAIDGAAWASLNWMVLLTVVILLPRWARHPRFPLVTVAVAVLAAGPWLTAVGVGLADPLTFVHGRFWVTMVTLGAPVIAIAVVRGVVGAAEKRNARALSVLAKPRSQFFVAVVFVVVAAVITLRMTTGRDLFGPLDQEIWTIRDPVTWVHATAIAACMFFFSARSLRHPLRPRGRKQVTLILMLAAMAIFLVFGLGSLVSLAVDAVAGGSSALPDVIYTMAPYVTVITVLALAVAAIWLARPRTLGLVMVVVGLVWFLPSQVGVVVRALGGEFPRLSASAGQVCLALTVLVGVSLVVGLFRRDRTPLSAAQLRLLVVPILVLHAATLLPDVWLAPFSRPLFAIGAVLALLLALPHTDFRPLRNARHALAATAAQSALLVAYFFSATAPSFGEDPAATIALLWLAIPLSAVLCCYVREQSPRLDSAEPAGAEEPDRPLTQLRR